MFSTSGGYHDTCGGYHEYIGVFNKNWKAFITYTCIMISSRCTEHPSMYSWYSTDVLMIFPRCTHGIPPMYSWYPPMYSWYPLDVLNILQCTEHTLYRVLLYYTRRIQKKWCSMSQYFTGEIKIHLLQHLLVLQSWYDVTTDATWKLCRATKIFLLLGVSASRATSFERWRHIYLSLRQSTTYLSMTSKPYSLSYFGRSSNRYFSIHSLWRYIIMLFRTIARLIKKTVDV